MTISSDKSRVNIIIETSLLEKVDALAKEANMSRSATLVDLIEYGYHQAIITKKVAGNKFVLKALQLVFGFTPEEAKGTGEALEDTKAAKTAKNVITEQLYKLAMEDAERKIKKDLEGVTPNES
jgi:hypothetical protein